jgi:glycosyltransferase involved in cell wall biosynthesis
MRYAETLVKRGDLVDVIALRKDGQPSHEVLRGVNVYRIQRRIKNEKGELSFLYRLLKFLIVSSIFLTKQHLKKAYQVIHVNNIPDFLVFAALFPKLLGAKVILDIHDIVPELYAEMFNQTKNSFLFKSLVAVEKASCTFADHVIIANHIWHKSITTRSVAENKCSVVLNYPDENVFFKRPRQRQDDKFVMIYPGSLNRRQGVDIAVKAFALIKDKIPMAEFHIYGTGTDMDYLKRLVLDLGLQDRVFLKGSLPIYEVAEKMANADLGIEPKRNDMFAGDAMSTKILEFMSLGIPVIASDTRVHKYYFDESVVLFFKSDDEQDLARCMLSLIENANLRQKMLLNSHQFVQGYVWDKRKEEYLGLVDRMTQGAG